MKPQTSYPSVKWNNRWAIRLCSKTADELFFCEGKLQWAIFLCSETAYELFFCEVKLHMSYPSVNWNHIWTILLWSETTNELSFCEVKPHMNYPSVKLNHIWTILLCSETADELSFCEVKLQMSMFRPFWFKCFVFWPRKNTSSRFVNLKKFRFYSSSFRTLSVLDIYATFRQRISSK